ncbi:MAG: ribonuclease III [bacterium]
MKSSNELVTKINLNFHNESLLQEALTHRSFINENKDVQTHHNERLEFLGDAVLELLVTDYLFAVYPERPEGELTSFRSATVKTESLAETALGLDLGEYLFMSKGEETSGGRTRPYILANAFEALIGAIYLDQGLPAVKQFLEQFLFSKIRNIVTNRLDIDSKSKLQEIAQDKVSFTPIYELISETGPDHEKIFEMAVKIGKNFFGKGKGHNKQEAEQNAAEQALESWENLYKKYFR